MEYRHEMKFLVSEGELEILHYRLLPVMKKDIHQKGNSYLIRSMYFDDINDSCKKENEDGIDNRRKFRIRLYDGSTDVLHLEKKEKYRGMTRKNSTDIDKSNCEKYMSGEIPGYRSDMTEIEKELYSEAMACQMMPKCIVEYERSAYIDPRGNVRITFDRNIAGCEKVNSFFNEKIYKIPVLPKGQHILEVKYDEFLPEYLAELLEIGSLQQTSFSKYYYVREALN